MLPFYGHAIDDAHAKLHGSGDSSYRQPVYQKLLVTLGTQEAQSSNTTGHSPYSYTWESRRIQFVYTASEITAAGGSAGSITAIEWDIAQLNDGNLLNYEIKMAATNAIDATLHQNLPFTVVKNAHTLTPGNTGWLSIPFDNPFLWNGTSNILIDVCWGVNTGFSLTGKVWLYNNVPNQKITENSSTANQCNTTTTLRSNRKPRARLTINATPVTDAYIAAITAPEPLIWSFNAGIKQVKLQIGNAGLSTIVNAQINWMVNGINQSPLQWSGSLSTNQIIETSLGSYNFFATGTYVIQAEIIVLGDAVSTNNFASKIVTVAEPLMVPFYEKFDSVLAPALPPLWSVQNSNDDNIQWVTSSLNAYSPPNSAYIGYNLLMPLNDWLFCPKIILQAGKTYKVVFQYRAHSSSHPEKLRLYWGPEANAAAMSSAPLVDIPNMVNTTYAVAQAIISPITTGTYHLGFHAYSQANQWAIYIDNVGVELLTHTVTFSTINNFGSLSATVDGVSIASGSDVAHGSQVVFNAIPNNGYRVKEWYLNGLLIANTTNTFVMNSLGSNATVSVAFELITGLENKSLGDTRVLPNPFSNYVDVYTEEIGLQIVFYSANGKKIIETTTNATTRIETSTMPKGVYILMLKARNGKSKLIKMLKM